MNKTPFVVIASTLLCFGASVYAAPTSAAAAQHDFPPALQTAIKEGISVVKRFDAPSGLTGWVVSSGKNQHGVLYTTADGQYVLNGSLIDASGKDLSQAHFDANVPAVDFGELWTALEKSTWFAEKPNGKTKSVVYVFKDMNCVYCNLSWHALKPYRAAGLEVRWVPVAFLSPSSMDKAGMLLAQAEKDNGAALDKLISRFHDDLERKVKSQVTPISDLHKSKIESNNSLMLEWGFSGTPVTVYKTTEGQVAVKSGMFKMDEIPAMTGLPAQKNEHPALERFR